MRALTRLLLATSAILTVAATQAAAGSLAIKLTPLGSYREDLTTPPKLCRSGIAQISAYDSASKRLFVTDATDNALYILDIVDPSDPKLVGNKISVASLTGNANTEPPGVASARGLVALAVESTNPVKANGRILLLDRDGKLLRDFDAMGSGPERVAFSPDGRFIVATVQGEQDPADAFDPKGGITIIDTTSGNSYFADFSEFSSVKLSRLGARIGPNPNHPDNLNPAEKDLEPHGITIAPDSLTAFVTLKWNNALAVVDLPHHRVTGVLPFGLKDHSKTGNGLDPSKDDNPNGNIPEIGTWQVWGAYTPDGIASFVEHFQTYLVTANTGDTRDLITIDKSTGEIANTSDAIEVRDASVTLDPMVFKNGADQTLKNKNQLGRLEVSTLPGDAQPNASGKYTRLVSLGGRSISVWTTYGRQIYDSGDQLEQITADPNIYKPGPNLPGPNLFNTTDDDNSFDNRSPRRGPQPQGVVIGDVDGRTYAFVGLRKQGGIIVADVTTVPAVTLGYFSTRNFTQNPLILKDNTNLKGSGNVNCEVDTDITHWVLAPDRQSDFGPEGLLFIPGGEQSPNGKPLLVVNYDVSGSTRIYEVDSVP